MHRYGSTDPIFNITVNGFVQRMRQSHIVATLTAWELCAAQSEAAATRCNERGRYAAENAHRATAATYRRNAARVRAQVTAQGGTLLSDYDHTPPIYADDMSDDERANEAYLDSLPVEFWTVRTTVTRQGGEVVYDTFQHGHGEDIIVSFRSESAARRHMENANPSAWAWVGDGYRVAYSVERLAVVPF